MLSTKKNKIYEDPQQVVVAGVGGAGLQVLDRLVLRGLQEVRLVALDSDSRMLDSCVTEEKIQLGRKLTRGLDTGGDPDIGAEAAEEVATEFLELLGKTKLLFLIAGLGGGTGTGALPQLAKTAAQNGVKIVSLVTLPFDFEGRRRKEQAQIGLKEILCTSDATYVLPNEAVLKIVGESKNVFEAFEVADELLGQISRGLSHMLAGNGFLCIDWSELVRLLEPSVRDPGSSCWVGWGEDATENRSRVVVDMILSGPFLSKHEIREQADEILISITGGSNMLFSEVEYIVHSLRDVFPHGANLQIATRLDDDKGDELSVLVIATKISSLALSSFNKKNSTHSLKSANQANSASHSQLEDDRKNPQITDNQNEEIFSTARAHTKPPGSAVDSADKSQEDSQASHSQKVNLITETPVYNLAEVELPHVDVVKQTTYNFQKNTGASQIIHGAHLEPPIEIDATSAERNVNSQRYQECLAEKTANLPQINLSEQATTQILTLTPPKEGATLTKSTPIQPLEGFTSCNDEIKQAPPQQDSQQELFSALHNLSAEIANIGHSDISNLSSNRDTVALKESLRTKQSDKNPDLDSKGALFNQNLKTTEMFQQKQQISGEIYFTREPDNYAILSTAKQEIQQEALKFDPNSRSRFDKTEATLHNGENLDVPTFLRKQRLIRQVIE